MSGIVENPNERLEQNVDAALQEMFSLEDVNVYGHGTVNLDSANGIMNEGLMPQAGHRFTDVTRMLPREIPEAIAVLNDWQYINNKFIVLIPFKEVEGEGNVPFVPDEYMIRPERVTGYESNIFPSQMIYGYYDATKKVVVKNPMYDPNYQKRPEVMPLRNVTKLWESPQHLRRDTKNTSQDEISDVW